MNRKFIVEYSVTGWFKALNLDWDNMPALKRQELDNKLGFLYRKVRVLTSCEFRHYDKKSTKK